MAADYATGFTVQDPCTLGYTAIGAIQGSGPTAAVTGAVITKGVVTADFEGTAAVGGFYSQDSSATLTPAPPTASSCTRAMRTGHAGPGRAGHRVCAGAVRADHAQRREQRRQRGHGARTGLRLRNGQQCDTTDVSLPYRQRRHAGAVRGHAGALPPGSGDLRHERLRPLRRTDPGMPATGEPRLFIGTEVRSPDRPPWLSRRRTR